MRNAESLFTDGQARSCRSFTMGTGWERGPSQPRVPLPSGVAESSKKVCQLLRVAGRRALPGRAVAAEPAEETPGTGDVAGDLGAQLFRAGKFLFFAEALP